MRTSTERMFIEQLLDLCQLEHIPIGDIRRLEVVATSNGASIEVAFAVPGSHEEIQVLAKQPHREDSQ